ncbi:MAG: signal peptidase II [Elusimicrobiota bacterium]
MNKEIKKNIILSGISLFVFVLDRISKVWIMENLYFSSRKIFSFFSLTYVENTGVAFGFLKDKNMFFIFSNTFFLMLLLIFRRKFSSAYESAGLHLVIGGALGNIYDRIAYGFVTDFFDFSFFPAVFNIADASITAGAILIGWQIFFARKGDK